MAALAGRGGTSCDGARRSAVSRITDGPVVVVNLQQIAIPLIEDRLS